MPKVTRNMMRCLKNHIGCKVIITWVQLGKEMSTKTTLYQMEDFGWVNTFCMIGWNMAVQKVEDIETGEILFENSIIKSDLYWNSAFMMWWLRIRSYGLIVTILEVSKTTRQCMKNKIIARFKLLTSKKIMIT
jgi:hypothetical protein